MVVPIRPAPNGTIACREHFNRKMLFQGFDRTIHMEFGYRNEDFTEWRLFHGSVIMTTE